MRSSRFIVVVILLFALGSNFIFAQSGRRPVYQPPGTPGAPNTPNNPTNNKTGKCPLTLFPGEYGNDSLSPRPITPTASSRSSSDPNAEEVIKIDTTLAMIPVTVIDRNGKFVPYLTKCDFHLYEDGAMQEVTEFSTVETPFHVVLLLDTSGSTQFRLDEIQNAALAFVNQLRAEDKVMVVNFDSKDHVQCEFTNDRNTLRRAISNIKTGGSTRLYDAMDNSITDYLGKISGRKAIVLFTDGMDTSSRTTSRKNLELVEESEVIVFPIQYDTYDGTQSGPLGSPTSLPDIFGIPLPRRNPQPGRRWPFVNLMTPQITIGRGAGNPQEATVYLEELAKRSGGRHQNADNINDLNRAFSMIAEELRHQYSLGYYPTNTAQDGTFRRIKIRINNTGWIVRAKEGYRAPGGTQADQKQRPILKRRILDPTN